MLDRLLEFLFKKKSTEAEILSYKNKRNEIVEDFLNKAKKVNEAFDNGTIAEMIYRSAHFRELKKLEKK
jgi:hypothetical protein